MNVNIKGIMIYDLDYILGIVAMAIKCAVNFCMLLLLFELTDNINGWTFEQMLFLYGMSTFSYALWHCLFIDIITIPTYIQSGEFDRFLLKPLSPLFQIMMETFDEDGWGELIFGFAILTISLVKLDFNNIYILLIPLFCLSGCLIFAAISILSSSVAFYTVGNIDLTDNVMDFKEFAKYPLSIFGPVIRIVFTVIIPIGFIAYYPGMLFMDDSYRWGIIPFLSLPVSIVFMVFASWWWHRSLRKYDSSGH